MRLGGRREGVETTPIRMGGGECEGVHFIIT